MNKILIKNVLILLVFCLLPQIVIYYFDRWTGIVKYSDGVKIIVDTLSMILPLFAGGYLLLFNIKTIKAVGKKALLILFAITNVLVIIYSLCMLMFIYFLRNGVGF